MSQSRGDSVSGTQTCVTITREQHVSGTRTCVTITRKQHVSGTHVCVTVTGEQLVSGTKSLSFWFQNFSEVGLYSFPVPLWCATLSRHLRVCFLGHLSLDLVKKPKVFWSRESHRGSWSPTPAICGGCVWPFFSKTAVNRRKPFFLFITNQN